MTSTRRAIVAGVAALALALTGASPASGQDPGTAGPDAVVGDGGLTPGEAGTEADRRRPPVKVGLIEQVEGAFVTPEFGTAAEATIRYLNREHRGVGGHPLVAEVCTTDDTPASAAACAEQFADADDVHLVIESTTNPTAIADVLVPAGKPLLAGGVDMRNTLRNGVFVMDPGTAGISHALFSYAEEEVDVTSLTIFHADDPAIGGATPAIEFIAASAGLSVDAFVPLGFTDDLTAPIAAGIADESDGVMFIVAPDQCGPVGEALQTLGNDLPVLVAELCLTDDIVSSGLADDWYAGTQSVASLAQGREARRIQTILRRYGHDAETGGLAGLGVGYAWIARDVLLRAGAGNATDASVMQTLSTYSSSNVLGFDQVACPGPVPFVSACNASTLLVQVDDTAIRDVGGFVWTDFSIFGGLLGP